jgi:hypothetical protein
MLVSANVTLVMAGLDPAISRGTVREPLAGSGPAMTIGRHPTMGHRPSSPEMPEFVTVGMHS